MSLISDTDFLIHHMRLSYLRNVDDPYGPRILALSPAHASNQYILAAGGGLATELVAGVSPVPSDDEDAGRHAMRGGSGYPGATGLRYTRTIVGAGRTGGMGMRVEGRRRTATGRSLAKEKALGAEGSAEEKGKAGSVDSVKVGVQGPTPDNRSTTAVAAAASEEKEGGGEQADAKPAPAPVPVFVPMFKGAAEMEARRRKRMQDRQHALSARTGVPAVPAPPLSFSDLSSSGSSSSEDEEDAEDGDAGQELSSEPESGSDFDADDLPDADDDMDDDFDADFMVRNEPSGSEWDAVSAASSGAEQHSPQIALPARRRPRLTPVPEAAAPASASSPAPPAASSPSIFSKRRPPPAGGAPPKSLLTAMLAASSARANPFTDLYSSAAGRTLSPPLALSLTVFFPKSAEPARAMELSVRRDASVEEAIGYALWSYVDEGRSPALDAGMEGWEDKEGEEGERWKVRMSTVGWIMRIAEEDGEVDEDFPPPDRTGKISKFNFEAYAILEASPAQINQNKLLDAKIQRPTRLAVTKKPSHTTTTSSLTAPALGSSFSGLSGSPGLGGGSSVGLGFAGSLGPSFTGPQLFLRVRVADAVDSVHVSTTIPVSAGMYMQEALELVCRKRRLNPKEFALLLGDMSILIPLDRTVASLQGKSDLVLVKRAMLPSLGIDELRRVGRSTDPNASIFKRISEVPEQALENGLDLTTAYKKYTVYRNRLVGREERTLAIDGAYIHIMPSSGRAKAVFESGKTLSYHVKDVACQQLKASAGFRLIVHRDDGKKRFDFEAEAPRLAKEIVETIKGLRTSLDRSGTVKASRRSRHVG